MHCKIMKIKRREKGERGMFIVGVEYMEMDSVPRVQAEEGKLAEKTVCIGTEQG